MALDDWADKGIAPPSSNYPVLVNGTLLSMTEAARTFPAIPGVKFPTVINEFRRSDFGPDFKPEGGIMRQLPPVLGPSYRVLVPKPDQDGLDVAGVRPIEVRAPIGTNVGWNTRAPGPRAADLCGLTGAFFPFATTKGERVGKR